VIFAATLVIAGNDTAASRTSLTQDVSSAKPGGCALLCRQFRALFAKRLHYVLRSKKAFFSQVS